MARLTLHRLEKRYGDSVAVHPTDLAVADGEFVTLLGPSGCGKSTLLRILCGIVPASGGEIHLGGRRIDGLPPERRDIAMVFQTYALFPHMNVRRNLGFGLQMKKVPAAQQRERIDHAVSICSLGGLLERMPAQLSGGQQQRVALARAIVMRPALLLLDEPLSNLDAKLRDSLREELVRLHRSIGTTSVYVTHDQAEAMTMSDRIFVMSGGRVLESGTPVELYRRPQHEFTACFLGHTNLMRLPLQRGGVDLPWGQRWKVAAAVLDAGAAVGVSVRPEDIALTADPAGSGTVTEVSFGGVQVAHTVRAGEVEFKVFSIGATTLLEAGTRVRAHASAVAVLRP